MILEVSTTPLSSLPFGVPYMNDTTVTYLNLQRQDISDNPLINEATKNETKEDMSVFQYRVVPIFFLILCVVGLVGNGLVISVLLSVMRRNRPKSVSDILVINLAVADFIFVGSLPFWATEQFLYKQWLFGNIGCKVLSFNTLLNLYGSVFFVVAMGIDRCLAVVYALEARNHRTPGKALVSCIIVWLMAVAVASQALVWREVMDGPPLQCVWTMKDAYLEVYFAVRVTIGFVVPFILLVICYVLIIVKLRQQITAAILAVMSLFVVCWLPNHIVTVMSALNYKYNLQYDMKTANLVSVCLAYANSATNPILYAFMKEEIRQEGARMLRSCFSCCHVSGLSRARASVAGFRGMKFSFWRSHSTATGLTAIPRRYSSNGDEMSAHYAASPALGQHITRNRYQNSTSPTPEMTRYGARERLPDQDSAKMVLVVKMDENAH